MKRAINPRKAATEIIGILAHHQACAGDIDTIFETVREGISNQIIGGIAASHDAEQLVTKEEMEQFVREYISSNKVIFHLAEEVVDVIEGRIHLKALEISAEQVAEAAQRCIETMAKDDSKGLIDTVAEVSMEEKHIEKIAELQELSKP
jgi:hypothetical protein